MDLLVSNTSTEIVDTYQSSAGTSAVHQDFGLTPIQREEDVGANDWVIVRWDPLIRFMNFDYNINNYI